jgi:hypothetical protein
LKGIVFDNFTFSRLAAFCCIRNAAGVSPFGYPIRLKTIRFLKIRPPPPLFLGRLTRSLLFSLLSYSTALYFFFRWLLLSLSAGLTLRVALPRNAPEAAAAGFRSCRNPLRGLLLHRRTSYTVCSLAAVLQVTPCFPLPPSPFALVAI